MAIQAVIFDMDGVLVDSETYWFLSRQEFARERGKDWTPEIHKEAMGVSTIEWATIMKDYLQLDMPLESLIKDIKGRVIAHYEEKIPARPGAIEAVHLAAEHYRVGLASGSPTEIIQAIMRLTGLDQVFETVVYGDTVPNGKPAPDIYIEALKRLDMSPDVSIGIEDSRAGIAALKAAGMYAIAAPSPEYPLPDEILAQADAHITTLEDFSIELVQQIGG